MGNATGSDPDVALMLAVQAGEASAFERLVERHSGYLANFFYRQVGRRDLALDLTQETFFRLFRARARYQPRARFRTYLVTIATNVALNRKRYESTRQHLSLDAPASGQGEGPGVVVQDPKGEEPSEGSVRRERAQQVRRAVQSLPENQRLAVMLHRFEGFSYAEIAGAMDVSVKAVKSLLNRAKENLRKRLTVWIKDDLSERGSPLVRKQPIE